ncbi:hypothetical protein [Streptomyces prasinus]|uniref:hypothetical protein n=1 Tax=Streptomyces prasinus TaxID=67345 RepID=UPI00332A7636
MPRDPSDSAPPGVGEIAERLRIHESCRDPTRSAVNHPIGHLAFAEPRPDPGEETGGPGR